MSKPHALYIAWGFPPSRGSGVYRALATANALVAAGFDVTVLTCEREAFIRYTQVDASLEALVDPSIDVVRIPFEWPAMDHDIRRWERKRAQDPLAWRVWRPQEDQRDFPESNYGPWKAPLCRAAEAIHARRPVDLTVATANPNVDIAAAHHLHETHGVPFVMDQRDAWLLNTYQEVEVDNPRAAACEREFVAAAQEVWFVNSAIRDWHAERYPEQAERIRVVANGYDPDLAPRPRWGPPAPDKPLVFGYIGTILPVLPLDEFLAGWGEARRSDPDVAQAEAHLCGHLGFFGKPDQALADKLAGHAEAGVVYRGPVPKAEVRDRFEEFDVLLFILGSGRFLTSGKVFEYMASGLPIVSVHVPEVHATDVLAGYPLWFPVPDLRPESVAAALVEAGAAARAADEDVRRACVEYAAPFERSRQLAPRLEALRELVTAGAGR
ncbi:MAG: glycosyl transferase [Nocardioides sp.]|nr:glycosyl transferase [Nocardioides sp.]